METIEQMQAKHAAELEKLTRQHALAALAPVPPRSVQLTASRLGEWIHYDCASLWEALDLMHKFQPVPFYEFKGTFTCFVPVALNVGRDAGEERSGPYIAKIKVDQGEGFGPSVKFCFFAMLGDTLCEIHCRLRRGYDERFGQYGAGFVRHRGGRSKVLDGARYVFGSFRPNTKLAAMMDKTTQWGSGSDTACSFSYAISADDEAEPCGWKDAGLRLTNIAEAMHGAREVTS